MPAITRQLHQYLVGRITFPLVNAFYNRRRILSTWRRLLAVERLSPEQLERLQLSRLRELLAFANTRIPFYRRRFAEAGLAPDDIRSLKDLSALPPLTREELVGRLGELIDCRQEAAFRTAVQKTSRGEPIPFALFRRRRLVRDSTSGSTGEPVVTFEDGAKSALNWALELRCRHWFGLAPGAAEARFARDAIEVSPKSFQFRMRRLLWNQMMLRGFGLDATEHGENLRLLNRARPGVLWGCTTTLVGLAEFICDHERSLSFTPDLVITWAEPLSGQEKTLLEGVFRCPTTNIYGSHEAGHIGMTCPEGTLHSNQESFLLETGRPYSDDCPGELLVTPLSLSPLPLIRYPVGDLAELGPGPCPCGRSLQVIRRLSGRSTDRFVTGEGQSIPSLFWTSMFARDPDCKGVRTFQTVFRSDGGICFRIVRRPGYLVRTEDFVRDYVRQGIRSRLRVEFEYVDAIPAASSGKIPLVVDER